MQRQRLVDSKEVSGVIDVQPAMCVVGRRLIRYSIIRSGPVVWRIDSKRSRIRIEEGIQWAAFAKIASGPHRVHVSGGLNRRTSRAKKVGIFTTSLSDGLQSLAVDFRPGDKCFVVVLGMG